MVKPLGGQKVGLYTMHNTVAISHLKHSVMSYTVIFPQKFSCLSLSS